MSVRSSFLLQKPIICQDRLGTNTSKSRRGKACVAAAGHAVARHHPRCDAPKGHRLVPSAREWRPTTQRQVTKRIFAMPFCTENPLFTNDSRDKHRENSTKGCVFLQRSVERAQRLCVQTAACARQLHLGGAHGKAHTIIYY